ncbi:MAG: aldehyde dehydrogenase family protein, partial [Dactylosporangium sp.]|nr:aldehyde dehydrogenase family protein [Dactylosporangium sp.]NNJ62274.1 aldehyde dehydrogenase family protein [Dactylosporangium sp.]
SWAARHARRVLRPRRVGTSLLQPEHAARVEYRPYGVVGVIGPWNYPAFTPLGSIGSALAAGNAVVLKPSEYTPAVGAWLADRFGRLAPEQPVLGVVHGLGDAGAALCRSGVDKIAFTGSPATGRRVLAACAQTLTPVLLECGGKDAMVVAEDADVEAAAQACAWGAMTNAGQTCVGIERVYVADAVHTDFLGRLVDQVGRLTAGVGDGADIGPITRPGQIDIIRAHIEDALARGARAVVGGAGAITPPYVLPTVLVDVPDDALIAVEETFGPTLTVHRVRDACDGLRLANASPYGLGGSVFSRSAGLGIARAMRSGMTSVNAALSFAGAPALPMGGIGLSGYGRVHGADGLREFAWVKSIARRRFRSPLATTTFDRTPRSVARTAAAIRLVHGRRR